MTEITNPECFLCDSTLRDPVTLGCDHTFCFKCLRTFCKVNKTNNCPICNRRSSSKDLGIDFPLKQPANAHKTESSRVFCEEHPDLEPTRFCEDDQRALCLECDFQHNPSHTLLPVERAVKKLKEHMNSDLQALQDKKDIFKEVEQTYKQMMDHLEKQVEATEKQIKEEFIRIQQFLREDEEFRLKALREERDGKKKTIMREMNLIEEQISPLSESISEVERELQKPNVSFICSFKEAQTNARVQCRSSDPTFVPGVLIDMAKHVGNLGFRIWQKMKDTVHFTPVILDPNTANPHLWLSEDLSGVRCSDTTQKLPDNPERNSYSATVLGSKAFSSRTHSWDVQVGDHPDWTIGVANTSVDKKGRVYATPEHGIWCLTLRDGEYDNGCGDTIPVQRNPEKIRVQLDYDGGQVSFLDSEDMTHIYSHEHTFTEKLFPYFAVGIAVDAKSTGIRVCPQDSRRALESIYNIEKITRRGALPPRPRSALPVAELQNLYDVPRRAYGPCPGPQFQRSSFPLKDQVYEVMDSGLDFQGPVSAHQTSTKPRDGAGPTGTLGNPPLRRPPPPPIDRKSKPGSPLTSSN